MTLMFFMGCKGDNTDAIQDTDKDLVLLDGNQVVYESMQCIYRQHTGADDGVSLQLQFLSAPNKIAFELILESPMPGSPFIALAGHPGGFGFSVFNDDNLYGSILNDSEIILMIDDLPFPDSLKPGNTVHLRGSMELSQFSLPDAHEPNEESGTSLEVAAGIVEFDCKAKFQMVQVVP